ncbi:hypothetical protein HK101_008541 [Irineochytrium annulatum]|nr:hypothetical protein HK101_008541 [Irineochytrium annulatum]
MGPPPPAWLDAVENAFQSSLTLDVEAGAAGVGNGGNNGGNSGATSAEGTPVAVDTAEDEAMMWSLLGSEEERDRLLNIFFEMSGRYVLQTIHEGWFWRRLRSQDDQPTRSLVLTMCSIAASAWKAPDGSSWAPAIFSDLWNDTRTEALINAAILSLDLDNPSIDNCQALTLMVLLKTQMTDPQTSQEWLLSGMAMRMVPLLKLDVDPDVLERQSGRRWPWVEKETRRRLFAVICMLDEVDMIFRESSFGIWRRKGSVQPPAVVDIWRSVDIETGEPALPASAAPHVDAALLMLGIITLRCKVSELNLAVGYSLGSIKKYLQIKPDADVVTAQAGPGPPPMSGHESQAMLEVEPEIQFAILDAQLTMWYRSIPPNLNPTALASQLQFTAMYDNVRFEGPHSHPPFAALKVHLYYLAGVLALHRPKIVRDLMAASAAASEDPALVAIPDGCQESIRKCAQAAVGITVLIKRRIIITYPSPHASRLRPVASYLQLSAGYAMPLLESGLMNAVFLVLLGVGRLKGGAYEGLSSPVLRGKVAEVLRGVAGSRFREEAVEGLSVVLKVLQSLEKRRKVSIMREVLERCVVRMQLSPYLISVPELEDFEDLD